MGRASEAMNTSGRQTGREGSVEGSGKRYRPGAGPAERRSDESSVGEWRYDGRGGDDIALVFAPGGPVAALLGPSYRPRSGQAAMARLVRQALDEKQHALIEAGTGSGKSYAYLIPLIWTGGRAYVSTANKTLQNQLWEKDLPALQRIAPRPFRAALLKGRSNYVCLTKLKEARQKLVLPYQGYSMGDVVARLEDTESGDVEELRFFGELRDMLTVGRNECLGQRCPRLGKCYYELARIRAEKADIVVLNHALLACNLVLDGQIVEPRDAIVIDEAQDFVSYTIGALRLQLAYDRVPSFASDAVVAGNADEAVRGRAMQANHELFAQLVASGGRSDHRWAAPSALPEARRLAQYVALIHAQLVERCNPVVGAQRPNEDDVRHQVAIEWAAELSREITALGEPVPENSVRYCERAAGSRDRTEPVLCQEPIDVSDFLRESLWEGTKTVICTSATLTVGKAFDYFCRQTGAPLEAVIQRTIPSPFDYGRQALLYTPEGLDPRYGEGEERYVRRLAAEVERLVTAARGRAFVLCTSTRRVGQLFGLLEPRLPFSCYRQGMAAREELLDSFRTDEDGAVLFATRSFWQGVDVPGPALILVIIDKLPFAPYEDPVVQRRRARIDQEGGNSFTTYMLPEAVLALKQGAGRLIRSETDRGVIAILDSRINTRSYGPEVMASLPPAKRTLVFEDVVEFLGPNA